MYFFATQSELPEGVGFGLFGPVHLAWLAAIALGTALGLLLLWSRPRAGAVVSRIGALVSAALVMGLDVFLWCRGALTLGNLPLHLCDLAPFLLVLFSFTGWDWAGQTIYCLCLPGAAAALLFPDWVAFPLWSLIDLQGFLLHGLLVFCPLLEVSRGRLHPRLSHMWKAWAFLGCVVPPIYLFDLHFHTNYFFLRSGSPGSPLELLIDRMGDPGFLVGYAAIALAVTTAMYLPWEIRARRGR